MLFPRKILLQLQKSFADEIKALASLPPKEVLIAKMLGSMNAPISGFVNVLQGTIRNVVYALEAVRKQKESA